MLQKTIDKLIRKEQTKPLHCIDTNVFLESTIDTKLGEICRSHLSNMGKGKYYRGVIPVSVLGETMMIIFRDNNDPAERMAKLDLLEKFMRMRNISFAVPKSEDHILIDELIREYRVEELDAEHLASGKRAGADAFVTFDSDMLNNKTLKEKLGLEIKHPKEFI